MPLRVVAPRCRPSPAASGWTSDWTWSVPRPRRVAAAAAVAAGERVGEAGPTPTRTMAPQMRSGSSTTSTKDNTHHRLRQIQQVYFSRLVSPRVLVVSCDLVSDVHLHHLTDLHRVRGAAFTALFAAGGGGGAAAQQAPLPGPKTKQKKGSKKSLLLAWQLRCNGNKETLSRS